jgi:uncharacterized protein
MTISRTTGYRSAMKFTLEPASEAYLVRGYSAHELRIGSERLTRTCVVTPQRLLSDFEPDCFAALTPGQLEPVFALAPELVIIGTGPLQQFPSAELRGAFARQALGFEVMSLGAACRTYNVLVQEGRRPAAVLFFA